MQGLNSLPVFRDRRTRPQKPLLQGHWNMTRMLTAIIMGIITMVIADTITVQTITATGINV
jgi:hypothetical protein